MGIENFVRLSGGAKTKPMPTRTARPKLDITTMDAVQCISCRWLEHEENGDYRCAEGIGGTAVIWGTRERVCSPPIDQWHYCIAYEARRGVRAARVVR